MRDKENPVEKLGRILEKSMKRLDPAGKLTEYEVWPIWDETVGPVIARNAKPERIRRGTLFVKVASSTWMQQLQFMKDMITEKLNQRLGKKIVKNIFFMVGKVEEEPSRPPRRRRKPASPPPAEAKPAYEELNSIRDPEIREALTRLYAAHAQKGKVKKTSPE